MFLNTGLYFLSILKEQNVQFPYYSPPHTPPHMNQYKYKNKLREYLNALN